jgi:hypothetical protein
MQISVEGARTAKFNKQDLDNYFILADSIQLPFSDEICH